MDGGPDRETARTILVADDEASVRATVRSALGREGYAVIEAADGEEALAQATSGDCDLVLLDVLMPGMAGWEVLRAIRRNHATRELPVVMLTVLGSDQDIATGWQLGADWYMAKPFDPHDVVNVVKRLLTPEPPG